MCPCSNFIRNGEGNFWEIRISLMAIRRERLDKKKKEENKFYCRKNANWSES